MAVEREQTNAAGQVVLKLKTSWRDRITRVVMLPLAFLQRLAAQDPGPRQHLIRCGVRPNLLAKLCGPPLSDGGELAANAKPLALEVPQVAEPPVACEASGAHCRPVRLSWDRLHPGLAAPKQRRRSPGRARSPSL